MAQARRRLAIALVMDGQSRTDAATAAGMDRQSLRDWVHRFNAEGPDGLRDKPRSGRPPHLSEEQLQGLDAIIEAGPDLETDGVVRWRCTDLQRVIAEKYDVVLGERSVGRILNGRRFRHVSVRPQHPKSDPAAQELLKKSFSDTVRNLLPARATGKPLEIWFQDEARVGQKGTLAYVWARCGTRPRAVRDTRCGWAYLFGAMCPERAVGAGLVLPYANTEAMNLHLVEISKAVAPEAHGALVLDGAGWHVSDKLIVPDNISLVKLPPYAPELNPMENVWAYLRGRRLAHRLFDSYKDILDACCDAWNAFVADGKTVRSIATRQWATCQNL